MLRDIRSFRLRIEAEQAVVLVNASACGCGLKNLLKKVVRKVSVGREAFYDTEKGLIDYGEE